MVHNPHAYIRRLVNPMRRICHHVIVAWEGHSIPATEKWFQNLQWWVTNNYFLLQNKIPTENKVDYLLVHRTRYIGKKLEILNFNTTWIKQCERVMRTFIFFFAEFIHIFAFLILQATTVQDAWYRISKLKLDLDIDLNIGFVSKNHMLE